MAGKSLSLNRFPGFLKNNAGAAYVEFAIVAVPFFLVVFGILQLGLIFWSTYDLENATQNAARLVRTGQAQGLPADQFKNAICANTVIIHNCSSKLRVNVASFQNLSDVSALNPRTGAGELRTDFNGDPSNIGPLQNVLVSVYYEFRLFDPLTSVVMSNLTNGNFLIQSSAVFRTEPFRA